jgi:hypothetical protein
MTVGDFLKEALERKYVGKSIKKPYQDGTFVVAHVEVRDGGVDPQWEISLFSELNRQMNEESRAWQLANNPKGGVLAPKELEDRWRVGWAESQHFTLADQVLPEIVEVEEEEEEDMELDSCESCGESAWDGYICHACGSKDIGE